MILYRAVIADTDCQQFKDRLINLEQRVEEILPMSQFNAFLSPADGAGHPEKLDIWVAIEGELTRPQLSNLEREIESTVGEGRTAWTAPRIVEKLIHI
jgi:hypothetical protein